MKIVSVEDVEKNFPALLRMVERGEELNVVRRRKQVARILPAIRVSRNTRSSKTSKTSTTRRIAWARHFAELDAIYGRRPAPGKPGSQIIIEGRR
jgi:antitoxin (DNA-binding transcriptional repressor) of toxin-antitoxin stability system